MICLPIPCTAFGNDKGKWSCIELLNEPTSKVRFESLKHCLNEKFTQRLRISEFVPTSFLVDFYARCDERLDKERYNFIQDARWELNLTNMIYKEYSKSRKRYTNTFHYGSGDKMDSRGYNFGIGGWLYYIKP